MSSGTFNTTYFRPVLRSIKRGNRLQLPTLAPEPCLTGQCRNRCGWRTFTASRTAGIGFLKND